MDKTAQDQKQLLTEIIQKLMVLLGADLTLSKVRNVHGITVSEDGTVTDVQAEPEMLLREIIEEFVGLSGEIVKQITELLATKQMQQKTPIQLPSAPFQPEPQPAETMTMPTPTSMPVTAEEPSTPEAVPAPAPQPEQPQPSQPTPETQAPQPTLEQPTQPQLSADPFPTTQPVAMPAMPTPEAIPAPAPQAAPVPGATTAPAQSNQTDPDMQHIINEALKQTK